MKVKKINKIESKISDAFCDITTGTGNFVLAESNCVIHNSHITSLLMVLFLKLTPQLIKEQVHIYRAIMPLYGAVVKGTFKPLYNEEEVEQFKNEYPNHSIQRYKGLGEMNPDQLEICLLDKTNRRLELIDFPENKDDIFNLMLSAELKRELI